MAHSYRTPVHWGLAIVQIVLFIAAVLSAYLSEEKQWTWFLGISILTTILFAVTKVFETFPGAKDLLAFDDMAAKLASGAIPYGVTRYFNMQDPKEQASRNEETQTAISHATGMWLCANSGASYLDPAIYRHWSFIEKRLSEGVEFRVVLLDPLCEEKGFRNQLNVAGEQSDSKINVPNLVKLHNTYPTLEIRFTRLGMHATVFVTDTCLFFDPYHVGLVNDRIENRSFCLKIGPTKPAEGVGLYRLFKAHFDSLWRSSVSIEDWIDEARETLPLQLPMLKYRKYHQQHK
jgi:hypothetical protein